VPALKQNRKPVRKKSPRSHASKTPGEKDAYNEKVKLAAAEGETVPSPLSRSSTLSMRSAYARESGAGIPDRHPIKPPEEREKGRASLLTRLAEVVTIVVVAGGVICYVNTLRNRVDFNQKGIDGLGTSFNDLDRRREELAMRITRLEQWKDHFSHDLQELQREMRAGVSDEKIAVRVRELEKRLSDGTDRWRGSPSNRPLVPGQK